MGAIHGRHAKIAIVGQLAIQALHSSSLKRKKDHTEMHDRSKLRSNSRFTSPSHKNFRPIETSQRSQ